MNLAATRILQHVYERRNLELHARLQIMAGAQAAVAVASQFFGHMGELPQLLATA